MSDVALQTAAAADAERAAHGMTSLLLGVPIVLKDNDDTADMVTTGGCGCWNTNQTTTDAFMVQGLRDAGAVILAKASLDEFAYGFASEFSSFQNPGSTLLVASPYDTSKTAGGSSGGTGEGDARGATVVDLAAPAGFSNVLNEGSGSTNEFTHDLNQYIETHLSPAVTQRTIDDILVGGKYVTSRRRVYAQRNGISDETYQAWADPTGTHTTQLATGKTVVTAFMDANDLDVLIYPSTTAYGTIGTNMRLSPNTGMPAVTLPMGSAGAGQGGSTVGVNLEWLGRDFSEGTLLGLAYDFEQATHYRTSPALYPAPG